MTGHNRYLLFYIYICLFTFLKNDQITFHDPLSFNVGCASLYQEITYSEY